MLSFGVVFSSAGVEGFTVGLRVVIGGTKVGGGFGEGKFPGENLIF